MIIRGEQDIADHVAAGRLDPEDAAAVHTFATFLRELGGRSYREALRDGAWRARWRGYVLGDADGPVGPVELRDGRYCPDHDVDLIPPDRTPRTRRYCPKCPRGSALGFPAEEDDHA